MLLIVSYQVLDTSSIQCWRWPCVLELWLGSRFSGDTSGSHISENRNKITAEILSVIDVQVEDTQDPSKRKR